MNLKEKKIVIIGGLGDGVVVAETIKYINNCTLVGFINDDYDTGAREVFGHEILCKPKNWTSLPDDIRFISALHKIGKSRERLEYVRSLNIPADRWANVIHPSVYTAENVELGHGIYIGPNVVIQPFSTLSSHISIRAGANLGHDVSVGEFSYIGPNAVLAGRSVLMDGVHVGPNACISDNAIIAPNSIIGGCTLVTKNTIEDSLMVGVPAVNHEKFLPKK